MLMFTTFSQVQFQNRPKERNEKTKNAISTQMNTSTYVFRAWQIRIAASVTLPVDPHFASQVVLWETEDRVFDFVFPALSVVVGAPISNAGRHLDPISSYHIYKFQSESKTRRSSILGFQVQHI